MVIHRHLAYAYCVGHLLVRQPLQIAQTENLLAEGRFEVVDELGQSVEPVVGIGIEYDIGAVGKQTSYRCRTPMWAMRLKQWWRTLCIR